MRLSVPAAKTSSRPGAHEDAAGVEVRTPVSLKAQAEQDAFAALDADAAVVVAYGLLLPQSPLLTGPAVINASNVDAALAGAKAGIR